VNLFHAKRDGCAERDLRTRRRALGDDCRIWDIGAPQALVHDPRLEQDVLSGFELEAAYVGNGCDVPRFPPAGCDKRKRDQCNPDLHGRCLRTFTGGSLDMPRLRDR
jgi:hypothetical protein